ncbi:MAG: AraC family transcriptional regulator [Vicinamibacterales bacterium]
MGADPAAAFAAIGLEPRLVDDPDAIVPMRLGAAFLVAAARLTGDEHVGLHMAEHADLRTFEVHFYAMAASGSLGEAYTRLCRYQRLIHETSRIEMLHGGDTMTLRHVLPGGLVAGRHTSEFLLATWVRAGREITGVDWSPAEVRFAHEGPGDSTEYARLFRAPVRFRSTDNAAVLPLEVLDIPCRQPDPLLAAFMDHYAADHVVGPDAAPETTAGRVRQALSAKVNASPPEAAEIARRLRMSVRTLNRLLAAEGTTFRALSARTRRELAERRLSNPSTSTAEVAFLLGFSELSAFCRAFKRWTGLTPGEFRSGGMAR